MSIALRFRNIKPVNNISMQEHIQKPGCASALSRSGCNTSNSPKSPQKTGAFRGLGLGLWIMVDNSVCIPLCEHGCLNAGHWKNRNDTGPALTSAASLLDVEEKNIEEVPPLACARASYHDRACTSCNLALRKQVRMPSNSAAVKNNNPTNSEHKVAANDLVNSNILDDEPQRFASKATWRPPCSSAGSRCVS